MHPFIQGITSSHEMGLVVGTELAAAIDRTAGAGQTAANDVDLDDGTAIAS